MYTRNVFVAIFVGLVAVAAAFDPRCRGRAVYRVTFRNLLTGSAFKGLIPRSGLNYSPLAGVSHTNRISFFTIRGFASREVEQIAETGINRMFIRQAERYKRNKRGVLDFEDAGKVTGPGKSVTVTLKVNCDHPFLTVIGMIAPSPDWIVQINNFSVLDDKGRYVKIRRGNLIAYDTGVDDGREFTAPLDLSLDLPTSPQKNIAPLVEDETDRFEGRNVGRYIVRKVR